MVYETKTLKILHGLTPRGERAYRQFLANEAAKILYRAQHPVRWRWEWLKDFVKGLFRC